MKRFEGPLDYGKFSFLIKNKNRDPGGTLCQHFLECLLATCKTRITELPEETELWRAQLGSDIRYAGNGIIHTAPRPFQPLRMKPLPQKAKGGRANSVGVPRLYLSTDRETAMAECRPWLAAHISIAMFYTIRGLRLVDLSKDELIPVGIDRIERRDADQEFAEKATWGEMNRAFAKPVQRSEPSTDYMPTQRIADFFECNGFDGLKYKSALGEGHNIALFDLSSAEQAHCRLFDVKDIRYSFEPIKGAEYETPFNQKD